MILITSRSNAARILSSIAYQVARNLRVYQHGVAISLIRKLHYKPLTYPFVTKQPFAKNISNLKFQSNKTFTTAAENECIKINNGNKIKSYNRRWLRENCQCDECQNHDTDQRNVLYYQLQPEQTQIRETSLDGSNKVSILWGDGHKSTFDLTWLSDNSYPGKVSAINQYLWNAERMQHTSLDIVPFDNLMSNDESVKRLLQSLLCYGVGIVSGSPSTTEGTRDTMERVCLIQKTFFGEVCVISSDGSRADTAYTNIAIGAHTDTTYLAIPVGVIILHVLYHHGEGGQTLLVDGFNAATKLREENPDAFDMLCKHRIHHKYKESDKQNIESLDPIIKIHPVSGELEMIKYNHYDRSVISTIPQNEMASYLDALEAFSKIMTAQENEFWLKLKPGNILFVDNWRVLHGRSAFTGARSLCSAYLPRDDWMGRARLLGLLQ